MGLRVYCSYCDHRYLPRALTLIESMKRHGFKGEIWLFCLSDECHELLLRLNLPGIRVVPLSELEAYYPELAASKANRETIEYYYTCAPSILHFAFAHKSDADWVTFLDADLCFFQSPDLVFDEIGDAPVAIVPHSFTAHLRAYEKYGMYNVGWVTFRRDPEGERCLDWWRRSCIEWCYGRLDGDRYADQKYLDRFSEIAPHTAVLTHKGCNLAPWNIGNYTIGFDCDVRVDDVPLIFFHFSGIHKSLRLLYFNAHRSYGAQHSSIIRNSIYKPYIADLVSAERLLKALGERAGRKAVSPRGRRIAGIDVKNAARFALRTYYRTLDLFQGRPIVVWRGRVM